MNDFVLYVKCMALGLASVFGICVAVLGLVEAVNLFATLFVYTLYWVAGCALLCAVVLAFFKVRNGGN